MIKATFLMLLLSVCVVAQVQPPRPGTSEPTTGTISGKVVNETGQPMAGASTFIRGVNSVVSGRTTVTDADGNFSVGGLEPALYTVAASAPAYTSIPPDPNAPPSYYRIGDSVRLELVRGGVITGMVTNAAGEPLVAVRVRATMIRDLKGMTPKMSTYGLSENTTDDRGIYRMYGLAPGTYLVSAGGFGVSQSFQFNPYESDLPTYAPSATRDNAAEVSVRGGEETNVDIRYRGEPGHSVSGTVKTSSASGSSILITPVGGTFMPVSNTFQPPGSRGFAFHGIADGEYDVVAQEATTMPGTMNPLLSLSEPKRIQVKGASVTGIELVPKPLATISGRFVLETSKIPECQGKRPPLLTETLLYTRRNEKDSDKENSPYVRLFGGVATPDAKGEFTLRNLSPGRHQFEPRFYARYWYLQSITIGSAPAAATAKPSKTDVAGTWTTLKHGDQITNLTITLAEGAASIRGRLTAAELPSGALVYLLPAEAAKADDVLRFFISEIGGDGTFALNNLPPGKYWIVQTTADDQTSTLTKLRQPEAATARAKLRKTAEAQKLEIELKPCLNLTDYELKQ
jgi:hypothetical protein